MSSFFLFFYISFGPKGARKGEIRTNDLCFLTHNHQPIELPLGVVNQVSLDKTKFQYPVSSLMQNTQWNQSSTNHLLYGK